jgi:hypothetical protein
MQLRALFFPLVIAGTLQLAGCSTTSTTHSPGGPYLSNSAGAFFEQSATLVAPAEGSVAGFNLKRAHRPLHAPQKIYIAAAERGVIMSEDGGAHWRVAPAPLAGVSDVVALPSGVLVIAGTDAEGQGYVLRSGDQGKSWETVLTIPAPADTGGFRLFGSGNRNRQAVVISISHDPHMPERVYAGTSLGNILLGDQSGKTWRTLYTLNSGSNFYSADQANFSIKDIVPSPHVKEEVLVILTNGSLFRVHGTTQELLKIPRQLEKPTALSSGGTKKVLDAAYIIDFPQALFVGVDDGAVVSRDRGTTWEQLPLPIDTVRQFNTAVVTVSPTNPTRLLVGINNVVYRSEDSGASWNTFSFDIKTHVISSLLIDPENAARVLAALSPLQT